MLPVELAGALNVTLAFPVPVAPPVIVIHVALLLAVQAQLLPPPVTITSVLELPPTAGMDRVTGERPNVQDEPDWVTVTVWPATVSVPVR